MSESAGLVHRNYLDRSARWQEQGFDLLLVPFFCCRSQNKVESKAQQHNRIKGSNIQACPGIWTCHNIAALWRMAHQHRQHLPGTTRLGTTGVDENAGFKHHLSGKNTEMVCMN